jgi:magnesium transporter
MPEARETGSSPSSHGEADAPDGAPRVVLYGWTDGAIERHDPPSAEAALALALSDGRFRFAWLDIEGDAQGSSVAALESRVPLPPLATDTLLEGVRRPGADDFEQLVLVTMRAHHADGGVGFVDFVLSDRLLVTLHERRGGDVFEGVRARFESPQPRLVRADANVAFLLLGRAVCDGYRPVLAAYHDGLERFERALVRRPDASMLDRVHEHRRQLLFLRQGLAPLREALGNMQASVESRAADGAAARARRAALRELQDEVGALLDVVEFQKDSAQHLLDLYLNASSNRLGEVVRVLTIISVVFMPMTLVAGIYGMNFEDKGPFSMPELRWTYGYPFALGLMLASAGAFLAFCWRKGWLGAARRARRRATEERASTVSRLAGPLAAILAGRRPRGRRAVAETPKPAK